MKRLFLIIFLVFFLSSCAKNLVCTTPYIISEDGCCLDSNNDQVCDDDKRVAQVEGKRLVKTEDLPGLVLEKELPSSPPIPAVVRPTPVDEGPFLGGKDAAITLLVFGDYADRLSQRFNNEVIPKLLERYGGTIRYMYRDVPVGKNNYQMFPAEAARCASDKGKFWEYHQRLFIDVTKLSGNFLQDHASAVGLDVTAFNECLHSRKHATPVLEVMDYADRSGVTVLPTVFVNNERISGYRDYLFFKTLFDEKLQLELADKVEDRRHITVDAVGRAYNVQRGVSIIDPSVTDSLYTNIVSIADASLYVDAEDARIKGTTDDDWAKLEVTLRVREYGTIAKEMYTIKLTSLDVSADRFGGLATDVFVFGNTGIGTSQLPRVKALVALFGKADVFDARNKLLAKDQTLLFFLTEGMRTDGLLSGAVDTSDTEAYLIMPGRTIGEEFPNAQGVLHLFFESVSYRVV